MAKLFTIDETTFVRKNLDELKVEEEDQEDILDSIIDKSDSAMEAIERILTEIPEIDLNMVLLKLTDLGLLSMDIYG